MPHFGLMDEAQMTREEAELMRAKLHLRSGRRQLLENKTAAGVATLYDALFSAMRWYILTRGLHLALPGDAAQNLENDGLVFSLLERAGILTGDFELAKFLGIVEQAVAGEDCPADTKELLPQIDQLMTRLGVMPFDESELPPEAPARHEDNVAKSHP